MPMPAGIATVTVTGRFVHPDGSPLEGSVTFSAPSLLTLSGADTIATGTAKVTLDAQGQFTATLIATDNANMQPTDWAYQVVENLTGVGGRSYWVNLPSTTPTVDLADIAPADPARGTYVLVPGPQGPAGNTILSGHGAPSSSNGVDGDYWMDQDTLTLYGPKTAGVWSGSGTVLSGGGGGLISSVNGKTGTVVLTASDVGADASGAADAAQSAAISAAATDAAGKVSTHAAASDPHGDRAYADSSKLAKAANLSDLPNVGSARSNLGLGGAATLNVGTSTGTVAAGDDSRLADARTPTAHAASHASGGSDPVSPAAIGAYTTAAGSALEGRATTLEQIEPDLPSDQGLLAWTYDPNMAGHVTAQSNSGVAGRITLTRLILRKQITWSNIWVGLSGVDTAAALTNCYLGVYDSSGNLKGATADLSSQLILASNAKALPFALTTPFTASAGTYFIAMLLNGTWATNTFTFKASGAGISVNANLSAPNLRYSNMLTGQTSLPSTLSLASQTTTIINTGWASQWYGVS